MAVCAFKAGGGFSRVTYMRDENTRIACAILNSSPINQDHK